MERRDLEELFKGHDVATPMFTVPEREIINREGVEERVQLEVIFRVTLTGGGKYRMVASVGKDHRDKVFDSLPEAAKQMAKDMIAAGGMAAFPAQAFAALFDSKDKP
jgi:hypothetical protein